MNFRSYTELVRRDSFEDRFRYLSLNGHVGLSTFGFDRWLNQRFYTSREWKRARRDVIARDEGCDLGVSGHEIFDMLVVHHMNPVTPDSFLDDLELILDPEFMITTTHETHRAIHYGDQSYLASRLYKPRVPGDTKLW